ncbi:MAG: glycoside hydrolase family 127 protein [Gemmatimonadota bacterium]|nr:MAG: glycoside hydrolase family 127 protein [Gemmatimonadota bacterium]
MNPHNTTTGQGSGLREPAFRPLPLGSIRPRGWLARQLRIQADGLSGHLDEFWPDVADSQWFGGHAEGWERAPYWLDGVIALAWSLGDETLQARVSGYVDTIVRGQRPDGWYSPYPTDAAARPYDLWAILLANKMLAQHHEATGEDAVMRAVEASLRALAAGVERTPLYNWGRYRWFEGLIPVFYVYERTRETWLLDLARRLKRQGFDYEEFYREEDVTHPTPRRGLWTWGKHVVNTGMAVKAGALAWRLEGLEQQRSQPSRMIALLDRYHGQATGMFTGDECLAGKNPVQGSELCAVVEFLYSLETALSVLGEPALGDRLERVAFNALPATFTPDMWAHQYDQQANQVQCTLNPDHMWTSNGPESNLYGLEPNYGCCTSNMHQGWPKLSAHLWMRTQDEGLAAVAYAPSEARFTSRGVPVTVALDSDYPFREHLALSVSTETPVSFPLLLRVPAWAENATLSVEGESERSLAQGTFHRIEREWRGTTHLSLRLPMRPHVTLRYNQGAAVERGPLVYALRLEESWTRINADQPGRELPHGDFEVRPASSWNYGLLLPDADMEGSIRFEERPVGERPFSPEGAGMVARVRGRLLPDWKLAHGWAGEFGPGTHQSAEPLEELDLIPYGCTNIRVTEFPRLAG